jgi:hypothetical protein
MGLFHSKISIFKNKSLTCKLMRIIKTFLLYLSLGSSVMGQSDALDAYIRQIKIGPDTIRSVFDHIANTIAYDVRLVDSNENLGTRVELLEYVLKNKRGVCEHYAQLFYNILTRLGYEVYFISGYTLQEGVLDTSLGHTWNAVYKNENWYLYDVTWAAGHVQNKRFIKKYEPKWYAVNPEVFRKTHFPFDPLWQLISHPYSHRDIQRLNFQKDPAQFLDIDSIFIARRNMTRSDRLIDEIKRIKQSGVTNQLVSLHLSHLNKLKDIESENDVVDHMNAIIGILNDVVFAYNQYVNEKNKYINKPNSTGIGFLDVPAKLKAEVQSAIIQFESLTTQNPKLQKDLNSNMKEARNMLRQLEQEVKWAEREKQK